MEPPVRPECRRSWDAIQPHILALLPTPSWELTALSSSQCIQLFQRHPLSARHGGHHSEHHKQGSGPWGFPYRGKDSKQNDIKHLVNITIGRTGREEKLGVHESLPQADQILNLMLQG